MITVPWWLKAFGVALLLSAFAYIGWTVAGWRRDSIKATTLQTQLDAERKARASGEVARIRSAGNLAAASSDIRTVVQTQIKRVKVLVHDDRACDFDGEITGVMNRARGYDK